MRLLNSPRLVQITTTLVCFFTTTDAGSIEEVPDTNSAPILLTAEQTIKITTQTLKELGEYEIDGLIGARADVGPGFTLAQNIGIPVYMVGYYTYQLFKKAGSAMKTLGKKIGKFLGLPIKNTDFNVGGRRKYEHWAVIFKLREANDDHDDVQFRYVIFDCQYRLRIQELKEAFVDDRVFAHDDTTTLKKGDLKWKKPAIKNRKMTLADLAKNFRETDGVAPKLANMEWHMNKTCQYWFAQTLNIIWKGKTSLTSKCSTCYNSFEKLETTYAQIQENLIFREEKELKSEDDCKSDQSQPAKVANPFQFLECAVLFSF